MNEYLVSTAEPPAMPRLPLLFFIKSRRRHILLGAMLGIVILMPITILSWGIHKIATPEHWWAFLLVGSVVLFLSFFLIVMIHGVFQTIKPGPVLIIYEEGIYDRRLGERIIPWSDITIIWLKEFLPEHSMICFEVTKTAQIRQQSSIFSRLTALLGRLTGYGTFCVSLTGLDGDTEAATSTIFALVKAANPDVYIAKPDRGPFKREE